MTTNTYTHTHTQTIPLFPLGTTLYPDGIMLLKIFEVRYLDMVKQCVREGSGFGVVTLNGGNEVRVPGEQVSFNSVGTLARIKEFDPVQPSLFMIQCHGEQRFKVTSSETKRNGLIVAEVDFIEDDAMIEVPEELKLAGTVIIALMIKQDVELFKKCNLENFTHAYADFVIKETDKLIAAKKLKKLQ